MVADVALLVVVEATPVDEVLLVVEVTPVDDVLLVVEVTNVVPTLFVVTTAAGVHCAYPRSGNSALNSYSSNWWR
jgi:hypothetical protein